MTQAGQHPAVLGDADVIPPAARELVKSSASLTSALMWQSNRKYLEEEIPSNTVAFSTAALKKYLRNSPAKPKWTGYMSADAFSELMTTEWQSKTASVRWIDNGNSATLFVHFEIKQPLRTAEDAIDFAEAGLLSLTKSPSVPRGTISHHLKLVDEHGAAWSGFLNRNLPVELVQDGPGKGLLRLLEVPKWHQYLHIATDGQELIIQWELEKSQPSPYKFRTPGVHGYFRFVKKTATDNQ